LFGSMYGNEASTLLIRLRRIVLTQRPADIKHAAHEPAENSCYDLAFTLLQERISVRFNQVDTLDARANAAQVSLVLQAVLSCGHSTPGSRLFQVATFFPSWHMPLSYIIRAGATASLITNVTHTRSTLAKFTDNKKRDEAGPARCSGRSLCDRQKQNEREHTPDLSGKSGTARQGC
jgi:hypothetical protein